MCDILRIMRPFGTSTQLAKRRKQALAMLRNGKSPEEVAGRVAVTERSIRRWVQEAHSPKPKRSDRPPGRPARLSPQQLKRLANELLRGAYAYGYAEDYWTLDRIARLIWDLFQVRYHFSSVWHILKRLGWSCQKPQRQGLARDEKAVWNWRRNAWPRIKKLP